MFDNHDVAVETERSSRKEPLSDDDVSAMLASSEDVWIAKGKKVRRLDASEAALDDLKGPTGNYRAPMVRRGATLLVGFNADALVELVEG